MRRLRREEGFALPLALAVILLVGALGAVGIALATHNVERSSRDRLAVRALAAADAGLDVAGYRMNKALVASRIDGLIPGGLVALTQETLGCLNLTVGSILEVELVGGGIGGCAATDAEAVDETIDGDGVGEPASFRYWIKSAIDLGTGDNLVYREIVSVGEAGGVVRRVMGRYAVDLAPPATTLFSRVSYVECTAVVPAAGANPSAGC